MRINVTTGLELGYPARVRLRVLECPRCGAPLPKRAALVRVVCEYCKCEVTLDRYVVKAAEYRAQLADYTGPLDAAQLTVGALPIRLLGRLATGHSTDVWLAERATRLSERLVVKLLRAAADEKLLRAEQQALQALEQSTATGAHFFSTLLPQRVAIGASRRPDGSQGLAAVFREPIGFAHTLLDVQGSQDTALEPRHIVWLWRRSLELLNWVHQSGWVHGALLPEHVLVNAREHALRFVGWSCAARPGEVLAAVAPNRLELYPQSLLEGAPLSADTDLMMLARSMLSISGPHALRAAPHVPRPLARLLEREANETGAGDAWRLSEEVSQAARESFGAPQFVALTLPTFPK